MPHVQIVDLEIQDHGTICLFFPRSSAGEEWLSNTAPYDAQFLGRAMVVEPRYVVGVALAAQEAGLQVVTESPHI